MSDLAAETDLLRAAVRRHLTGNQAGEDWAPLLSRVNWHHVLWLGRQRWVLLFLHETLKTPPLTALYPPEILPQLAAFREVNQLRSLARAREACQVQDLFTRHAIPALATDAWMTAQACGTRPDLAEPETTLRYLVPAADLDRASSLLTSAGHPLVGDPEKLIRPGQSPVLLNSGLGRHTAASRFWRHVTSFEFGGRTHRHPTFGHWLLLRIARLRGPEIAWGDAHDITLICRQIPANGWPDVLIEAKHFGLERVVFKTIAASFEALDLPLPEGLADRKEPSDPPAAPTGNDYPAPPLKQVAAPFLPTPRLVAERMLWLAGTGPGDSVYDLGCGDGRIAILAAKKFGARGFGIDHDPARIAEANASTATQGLRDRVTFACGDLFAARLTGATVVICYLLPQLQAPLQAKLRREATPGTRIVSHDYVFPGWAPEKTEIIRSGQMKISQIYLWRI